MNYKLFLAIVTMSCLCYGCSKDLIDEQSKKDPLPTGELLLNYSIEEMAGQTYAVKPLPAEEEIRSVFYIFQNEDGIVVGSSYRDDLNGFNRTGVLPIVLPRELEKYEEPLSVKLICNWESYLAKGTTIEAVHANLKGRNNSFIESLNSLAFNTEPPVFTNDMPMLFTGVFQYKVGSNNVSVLLKRKNVVFDLSIDLHASHVSKKIKVNNLSCNTFLFQDRAIAPVNANDSRSYEVDLSQNRKKVRVYALPNTTSNVVKMDLVLDHQLTKFNRSNQETMSSILNPYEQKPEEKEWKMNLAVENISSVFFSNQYVAVNVFSIVGDEHNINYTLNSWPNGKFTGEYVRDADGNGMGVTPTALEFEFADSRPLTTWNCNTPAPSGAFSKEIFVSSHGVNADWSIDLQDVPDWLTIERNPSRSSINVTVEPNFNVDELGRIRSIARKYTFKVNLTSQNKLVPVTISQASAPAIPSDVCIGEIGNKRIWLRDRYEIVDEQNFTSLKPPLSSLQPIISPNFYAEVGRPGLLHNSGVGDKRAKEFSRWYPKYYPGKPYAYMPNGLPPEDKLPAEDAKPGAPRDENDEIYYPIYNKCQYPGYEMINIEEATMLFFPRLRFREVYLEGQAALMYYITDGTNLCFVNITGLNSSVHNETVYSEATYIYVNALDSKYRYNKYPPYDKYDTYINGKGEKLNYNNPANRVYCYYAMELGYSRKALTGLLDNNGNGSAWTNGMLRCVRRETK